MRKLMGQSRLLVFRLDPIGDIEGFRLGIVQTLNHLQERIQIGLNQVLSKGKEAKKGEGLFISHLRLGRILVLKELKIVVVKKNQVLELFIDLFFNGKAA